MAHLLGSEYCIESLQKDVSDLQASVIDILSRVGRIHSMSWKYPDKVAADLDMNSLLKRFTFNSKDIEANQVSHVVLLELLIDRFLLLIHCLNSFADQHLTPNIGDGKPVPNSQQKGVSIALGLTVKKHCHKMVALAACLRQPRASETPLPSSSARDAHPPAMNSQKSSSTTKFPPIRRDSNTNSTKSVSFMDSTSGEQESESRSTSQQAQKCSQTSETAFAPCDLCTKCQLALRDVSQTIVEQCKSEALPTNLERFTGFFHQDACHERHAHVPPQQDLTGDRRSSIPVSTSSFGTSSATPLHLISSQDVDRWKSEIQKDLKRLKKHFQEVRASNTELKDKAEKHEKLVDALRQQLSAAETRKKLEHEDLLQERSRLRQKCEELSQDVELERQRCQELQGSLVQLQNRMELEVRNLQEEIQQQINLMHTLDEIGKYFTECTNKEEMHKEVGKMKLRLEDVEEDNRRLNGEMQQLNVHMRNSQQHAKSLEEKQQKLVTRLEELMKENDALQDEIVELREGKDGEVETVMKLRKEATQMQYKLKEKDLLLKNLEEAKDQLTLALSSKEECLESLRQEIYKLDEEKQLLIAYPDLNGPVNPDLSGTGDVVTDMANQIDANSYRIQLLTEQSEKLKATLVKLKSMSHSNNGGNGVSSPPKSLHGFEKNAWDPREDQTSVLERDSLRQGSSESRVYGAGTGPSGNLVNPVRLWDPQSSMAPGRSAFHQNCATNEHYIVVADERGGLPPVDRSPSSLSAYQNQSDPQSQHNAGGRPLSVLSYLTEQQHGPPSTRRQTSKERRTKSPTSGQPGMDPEGSGSILQWTTNTKPPRRPVVHACQQCGKMYKRKEDLLIHKLQCGPPKSRPS